MNFKIGFETNLDIPTNFVDNYLSISNPTYFVIYLYTFSKVYKGISSLSYADIAMDIEFATENDVIAAFKYYEQKGALVIDDESITFIEEETFTLNSAVKEIEEPISDNLEVEKPPIYDMREIEMYRKIDEGFRNLFTLAERCFGRTLLQSDMFIIFDIYERLQLPVEVIEYLLEHYTSKGITNMKYMEKIALDWYDKGIKTKDEAMKTVNAKNEDYMRVRKALGMASKRDKTFAEEKMFDKFYNEYGFSLEIILEGCDAAVMSSKESPSYNYLEGILSNWFNEGIKTLDDVKKRSEQIEENRKNSSKTKTTKAPKKNKFSNFSQKGFDYDKYEKLNRERLEQIKKGES